MAYSLNIVRKIWQNTLEIENIKDNDHFFLLGGDSLLASIVALSIGETIDSEIYAIDLYENPILNEFADLVDQRSAASNPMIRFVTS